MYKYETNMDFSTKCRCCLAGDEEMHDLFEIFEDTLTLANILEHTTRFIVNKDDGLPSYICKNCADNVVNFYNFTNIFEESERYLKSVVHAPEESDIQNFRNESDIPIKQQPLSPKTEVEDQKPDIDSRIEYVIEDDIFDEDDNHLQADHNYINDDVYRKIVGNDNRKHIRIVIGKEKVTETGNLLINTIKYCCEQCGDIFLAKQAFETHIKVKHKMKIGTYKLTNKKTKIKKSEFDGLRPSNLQCKVCKKDVFKTHEELLEHYKIHRFCCEECGSVFVRKSNLLDHQETHTSERKHLCPFCGERFRHRRTFSRHKRRHVNPREQMCEICGQTFDSSSTLQTHFTIKHTNNRNFRCDICGKSFPLASWLRKHTFRKHSENREKTFMCGVCGQGFYEKDHLKVHVIARHSDQAKVSCDMCGKIYSSNANLSNHYKKKHSLIWKPQKL